MIKKTTLIVLSIIATNAFCVMTSESYDPKPMVEGNRRVDELIAWNKEHPGELPPLTEQEKYEFFTKNGVPVPGSGAQLKDIKSIKMTSEQGVIINRFNNAQKTKGYLEQYNINAKHLLNIQESAEKEYNERKSIAFDPHDTHLYEVKSTMQMDYIYNGVPSNLVSKVIGYAPESVFMNKGWAGAVEFFVASFGETCAFHEVNIELTKSSAFIPKEIATYIINNKISTISVMGNNDSGYVYEVEWWDKNFRRSLECSSKLYSKDLTDKTIALAKKIDKEI